MALTRKDLLELQVDDNSYTRTFDFNAQMEYGVGDALTLGLAGAVVSGGVGMVNTGKAVLNMFGADLKHTKTEEVLKSWDWDETYDYYNENKGVVDAVGFALSTIVPASLGLKAAKYAQGALRANESKNLGAVALRRILVPQNVVDDIGKQVLADTAHVANRSTRLMQAAKSGVHQAAVETAFAETAILLSTNQHVTVNQNQLSYFEAVWDQKEGFLVGFGIGTGIGGLVNGAINSRAMTSLIKGAEQKQNKMFIEMNNMDSRSNRVGFVQGNKVSELTSRYKTSVEKYADLTGAELQEFQRREKELFNDLYEEVSVLTDEVTKGRTAIGRREFEGNLTPALMELIGKGNAEQVATTFRGAERVGRYNDIDFLFDPAAQPLVVTNTIDEFRTVMGRKQFGDKYDPSNRAQRASLDVAIDARGISIYNEDSIRFREAVINKEQIDKRGVKSTLDPSHLIGTIRHELGHGNTVYLSQIFDSKVFSSIKDEMVTLSRSQRPSSWKDVDDNIDAINAMLSRKNAPLTTAELQRIDRMQEFNNYMNSPLELMADSWAQFNAKDLRLREAANINGSTTRKLFQDNGALKTRLGKSEKLLGLKSGKMYDESQWSPTLADRGTPKMNGQYATAGKVGIKIEPERFSVLGTTPENASAHYFASSQNKVKMKKELEVSWDNFYELNRIQRGLSDDSWKGKVSIKLEDGSVRVLDSELGGIHTEFDELFTEFKSSAATTLTQRNVNKANYTTSDIARMIDTDEDFALAVGYDPDSVRFWSRDNDPSKPTVAKVFYQSATDESDSGTSALADVISQNNKVLQVNDEMNNSFFGNLDNIAGDGITNSKLNLIAPEPSWKHQGSGDMSDITAHEELTGTFKTFEGQYGESTSKGQAIAKFNEMAKVKGNEVIQQAMANVAQKISSSEGAILELNALDSRLRQQFFKFAPVVTGPEDAVGFLTSKIILADPKIGQKNIGLLMANPVGQKLLAALGKEKTIWTRDMEAMVSKIVNQKREVVGNYAVLDGMIQKDLVTIQNRSVYDFWKAKTSANKIIVDGKKVAAASRGLGSTLDQDVLYPGSLNALKYKHRMYVVPVDEKVWSHNQKGIIGASSPSELAQKEAQVKAAFGDKVKIVSKEDMELHFQKTGEFMEDFSLNEYQVNKDLARKGVNWDVAPEANPALVQHYIRDMARDWAGTVDNLTELRYAEEFAALQQLDGASQAYGTLGAGRQEVINTPFREMQNIMLNRTSKESNKSWRDAQQAIDKTLTTVFGGLSSVFRAAEKSGNYEEMTKYIDHYGLPKVYDKQTGDMLRTSSKLTDQALKELVPKVNGIAATLMLRLDFIQPMVNALSMPIMSVPEMNVLMKAIPQLKAQQIAKGLHVTVPETAFGMGTNIKLQMQAVKDFWKRPELLDQYYKEGIITNVVREMRQVADDITIDTTLDAASIMAKVNNAGTRVLNVVTKPADFAEDFVKFVAARQADLLMEAAGITDQSIRSATMRSYVTRVHGNYVHAQRPAVFQGFAGQAIGLFQTYQFNLIQSLTKKIGDKNVGAVASMMGIQAGMFGVQSVPGFKMLNDYIAGKSDDGSDFYTGMGETVGSDESEWILFGLASNFTKPLFGAANALGGWDMKEEGMELYTRGDLNPRTPFILPTSLDEVPIWALSTKFVANILNAAQSLSQGVDAGQVMAHALAHNGVNRPLAGVGAILAGQRTTSQGTLIADLSDISWFAQTARALGTKTLDESIAVQAFYRTKGYDTKRADDLENLGRSAKLMIQSGNYEEDTYMNFFTDYAGKGGKPEKFNQWMHTQSMGASESTILNLYKSNDSRSGKYLQSMMGNDIGDYIDPQL